MNSCQKCGKSSSELIVFSVRGDKGSLCLSCSEKFIEKQIEKMLSLKDSIDARDAIIKENILSIRKLRKENFDLLSENTILKADPNAISKNTYLKLDREKSQVQEYALTLAGLLQQAGISIPPLPDFGEEKNDNS